MTALNCRERIPGSLRWQTADHVRTLILLCFALTAIMFDVETLFWNMATQFLSSFSLNTLPFQAMAEVLTNQLAAAKRIFRQVFIANISRLQPQ